MRTSAYVRDRYLPQEFERETYQPRVMEIETDAPVVEKTPRISLGKHGRGDPCPVQGSL